MTTERYTTPFVSVVELTSGTYELQCFACARRIATFYGELYDATITADNHSTRHHLAATTIRTVHPQKARYVKL